MWNAIPPCLCESMCVKRVDMACKIDADNKVMVIGRGGVPITMWGMWREI